MIPRETLETDRILVIEGPLLRIVRAWLHGIVLSRKIIVAETV